MRRVEKKREFSAKAKVRFVLALSSLDRMLEFATISKFGCFVLKRANLELNSAIQVSICDRVSYIDIIIYY